MYPNLPAAPCSLMNHRVIPATRVPLTYTDGKYKKKKTYGNAHQTFFFFFSAKNKILIILFYTPFNYNSITSVVIFQKNVDIQIPFLSMTFFFSLLNSNKSKSKRARCFDSLTFCFVLIVISRY